MRFTTLVSTAITVASVAAQNGSDTSEIASFQDRLLSEAPPATATAAIAAAAATPSDLKGVVLESLRDSLQQIRNNIQTDVDSIRNAVSDTVRAQPAVRLVSDIVSIARLIDQARERVTGGNAGSAPADSASGGAAKRSEADAATLAKRAPQPPRGYRYRGCFLIDYSTRGFSVWPRGGLASGLGGIEQCAVAARGAEFLGATDLAGRGGNAFLCEWGQDTIPSFGRLRAFPDGSCGRRCPDGREGCGGNCFVLNGRFNCFYSIYSRQDDTCDGDWREILQLIQLIIQLILGLQGQSQLSGIPSVLTSQQSIESATESLRMSLGC